MLNNEYKNSSLKIFSLKGNEALAQEVADQVGIELGKCSVKRFSDGEIQINIEESIRGCDVFIIQPTSYPVNLHLMELLIMIDACKRASAATINIVVPYYGYARQDRKARSREPITAKLVANLIETAGATRMIALDLHAPQIQGFFDIPIDHLMGVPILIGSPISGKISMIPPRNENSPICDTTDSRLYPILTNLLRNWSTSISSPTRNVIW